MRGVRGGRGVSREGEGVRRKGEGGRETYEKGKRLGQRQVDNEADDATAGFEG